MKMKDQKTKKNSEQKIGRSKNGLMLR